MEKIINNILCFDDLHINTLTQTEDKVANSLLKELMGLFGASRAYIFSFDDERQMQQNKYEICAEGVAPEIDNLQDVPYSDTPWWYKQLSNKHTVAIDNIQRDLYPKDKLSCEILNMQGIKSIIAVPLIFEDRVYGYVGLDIIERYYNWTMRDIAVITAFANSYTSVIYVAEQNIESRKIIENYNEKLSKYINILNTIPLPVVLYNAKGDLIGANSHTKDFFEVFSYEKELNDRSINFFQDFEVPENNKKLYTQGKAFTTKLEFDFTNAHYRLTKDWKERKNEKVYLECTATPFYKKDKTVDFYIIVFVDITNLTLLTKNLNDARILADENNKLKSSFLANMSHEIRTPLNAILGFTQLLTDAENDEELESFSKIIDQNSQLLLQLINDILDLSKIESNVITFNNVDFNLVSTLSEAFSSFKKCYENNDIEYVFESKYDEIIVNGDSVRILQVLTNFITNAIKHTTKGHIKLGIEKKEEGVMFYVEDTGKGIPEKLQPQLFTRFAKLNDYAKGTGLGLAICKAIIDNIGGDIGFTSEYEHGSTFWVLLPM